MWTKNVSEERVILLEGRKRWTQRVIKERERERDVCNKGLGIKLKRL